MTEHVPRGASGSRSLQDLREHHWKGFQPESLGQVQTLAAQSPAGPGRLLGDWNKTASSMFKVLILTLSKIPVHVPSLQQSLVPRPAIIEQNGRERVKKRLPKENPPILSKVGGSSRCSTTLMEALGICFQSWHWGLSPWHHPKGWHHLFTQV